MVSLYSTGKEVEQLCAIHPTLASTDEFPFYRSAATLPEVPDLAILAVGARHCEACLRDALQAGVKAAIVVASGFSEVGGAGAEAEDRLVWLCREHGARLLGPNTLGLFVPYLRLDTLFVEHGDRSLLVGGPIAVVSQSGSVGVEALGYASASGFGLRAFVGLGNAPVSESDVEEMLDELASAKIFRSFRGCACSTRESFSRAAGRASPRLRSPAVFE
jgi:acyl-CoA synthetase (NDP forming)